MSKKLLLIEVAVAVTIVILEALIEEADKLSPKLNDNLDLTDDERSPRSGPIALAVLCLFFSLVTILLWVARFFEPVTGSRFYVHSMNALHFIYCVATVVSSSLEVLKFHGLHLKHFSYAPLTLAGAVVLLVTIELLYVLFIAPRAEANPNAMVLGNPNAMVLGNGNPNAIVLGNGNPNAMVLGNPDVVPFGPTPSQFRGARAAKFSMKKSVKLYY